MVAFRWVKKWGMKLVRPLWGQRQAPPRTASHDGLNANAHAPMRAPSQEKKGSASHHKDHSLGGGRTWVPGSPNGCLQSDLQAGAPSLAPIS